MAGIIWIASYPKSGNTWVRAFLASCLMKLDRPLTLDDLTKFALSDNSLRPLEDYLGRSPNGMTFEEVKQVKLALHRFIVDRLGNNVIIKSHSNTHYRDGRPAINWEVSSAAVYVMRNPLDVAISFSHHFGVSIDDAIKAMNSRLHVGNNPNSLPTYQGSWREHVDNWLNRHDLKKIVLRYEDLLSNPLSEFTRLARFMNVQDSATIKRALEESAFERLKRSESKGGFEEKSPKAESFFRQGKDGQWRDILSDRQVERIIDANEDIMGLCGYLDDAGKPAVVAPKFRLAGNALLH